MQIGRRADAGGLEVQIEALPMARLGLVDLVEQADAIVFLDGLLPPAPGAAVEVPVGECVDAFDAAPVGEEAEFGGAAVVFARPVGLAEDWILDSVQRLNSSFFTLSCSVYRLLLATPPLSSWPSL